jgi:N-acyl-phosphatidylethanolamine-hydrolysing phospholipase D
MLLVAVLLGLGLSAVLPDRALSDMAAPRAHHRPDGFSNPDGSVIDKPLSDLLRWRWSQVREGLPRPPADDFWTRMTPPPNARAEVLALFSREDPAGTASAVLAVVDARPTPSQAARRPPALAASTPPGGASLTWIGHASMALRQGGQSLLIDPVFSDRVSPVSFAGPRRKVPLPLSLQDFSAVDTVLISHNHYDHLDEATVRGLLERAEGEPRFIVPLGLDRWLRERGARRVQALDWWESVRIGDLTIHLVPAQHWSTRSLWDRNQTLWGGFVLESDGFRFYYSGDTAYSQPLFASLRARFGGFDLAAIPVGAYAPRWFMRAQHTDPAEAVQAMMDLDAVQGVGVHWGSFELSDESLDEPLRAVPAALGAAGLGPERLALFRPGETRHYPPQRLRDTRRATREYPP